MSGEEQAASTSIDHQMEEGGGVDSGLGPGAELGNYQWPLTSTLHVVYTDTDLVNTQQSEPD